jgi:hypothetical protein
MGKVFAGMAASLDGYIALFECKQYESGIVLLNYRLSA